MGAFNNYVDRRGWVGGQSSVYAYKVNDLFLLTLFVYKGWVVKKVKNTVYVVIECPPSWFLDELVQLMIQFIKPAYFLHYVQI